MARCQGIVIFRFVLGSNAAYRSLNGSVEVGRGLAAAKLHRVDADRSIDAEIGTATLGDVQENRRSLRGTRIYLRNMIRRAKDPDFLNISREAVIGVSLDKGWISLWSLIDTFTTSTAGGCMTSTRTSRCQSCLTN